MGNRRRRVSQHDNHETKMIFEGWTPEEILLFIRPKGGLKLDSSSRAVIFEDFGNCSQDDLNFIVNGFTDVVLLLLIKAGSDGMPRSDIIAQSVNHVLLARLISRLNFVDD